MMTAAERDQFATSGWAGPWPLLTPDEVDQLVAERLSWVPSATDVWSKSLHVALPAFRALVKRDEIVSRVVDVLGRDVLAWGATTTTRIPRQRHRWHRDVEHHEWRGVTAFVGLRGMQMGSSLSVMSGSHRLDAMPQDVRAFDVAGALALAQKADPRCRVETVRMIEGEFFLFDGRVWHGSHNLSAKTRTSATLQFCAPDQRVRVPMAWEPPLAWHPTERPACLLVSGADCGVNRVVE